MLPADSVDSVFLLVMKIWQVCSCQTHTPALNKASHLISATGRFQSIYVAPPLTPESLINLSFPDTSLVT